VLNGGEIKEIKEILDGRRQAAVGGED